ncbi:MAG: putative metal-dependent hydrolase [Gemmatimonadota bacterium]|nr:putative metal-dependent hydrolase [Gemmatimonadota bacterium]
MTLSPEAMSADLSFPIGKFTRAPSLSESEWQAAVATMATQPARLRSALAGLNDEQLDTPYRPGGWTVRQLAHHVPDSHMNMYTRLKLALTEDNPTIKPYDQDAWSKLSDVHEVPVATSLALFDAVHERALSVLRHVTPAERERTFIHPQNGPTRVDQLAALYAWHGDHHIAHVQHLRARMGW